SSAYRSGGGDASPCDAPHRRSDHPAQWWDRYARRSQGRSPRKVAGRRRGVMTPETLQLRKDHRLAILAAVMLACFFVWAYFFQLAEVSSGTGKVIPSSREQVVQSLEGGVLSSLSVRQGDIVEKGQLLAQLDPTQSAANVAESEARYYAAIATAARLRAEVSGGSAIDFPESLADHPDLIATEKALFVSRRQGLSEQLSGLTR